MPRWNHRKTVLFVIGLVFLVILPLVFWNLHRLRRLAVITLDVGYAISAQTLSPSYPEGSEHRIHPIHLTPIVTGLDEPTDLQPIPGTQHQAVVLQKGGDALWIDLHTGEIHPFFSVPVITESEQGLLGIAFPPDFQTSKRFYLDYTVREDKDYTRIHAFHASGTPPKISATPGRILLNIEQPYQNHNAGQIGVGPDELLYISMGDGGFANDPHGHGQNTNTLLGTILRIDPRPEYPIIPSDNPVLPNARGPSEIWAYGLRNPWRFSWDDAHRLIVADVGQDLWEELHLVEKGDNLGWNRMEGNHCFPPDPKESCDTSGLIRPIFEYDHDQGNSITGGFVSRDPRDPDLLGKYVFGDFVRGQLWAIDLPEDRTKPVMSALSLGKWPLLISSFGQDGAGHLYVLDYAQGRILRVDPVSQ